MICYHNVSKRLAALKSCFRYVGIYFVLLYAKVLTNSIHLN